MWFNVLMGIAIVAAFLAGVGIGFMLGAFYFEGEGRSENEYD